MIRKQDPLPPAQRGARWYFTVLAQSFPDWVGLNFIFLLTCLPIFTIGPALSAMGYVMEQMVKDMPVKLLGTYWSAFRNRFFPKVVWGILFVSLNVLLFTATWYYFASGGLLIALAGLALAGLILLWGLGLHLFPALTWPETPMDALRNAWMSLLSTLPKSVLAVILALGLLCVQLLLFPATVPLTLTVGAVLPALALVFPLRQG